MLCCVITSDTGCLRPKEKTLWYVCWSVEIGQTANVRCEQCENCGLYPYLSKYRWRGLHPPKQPRIAKRSNIPTSATAKALFLLPQRKSFTGNYSQDHLQAFSANTHKEIITHIYTVFPCLSTSRSHRSAIKYYTRKHFSFPLVPRYQSSTATKAFLPSLFNEVILYTYYPGNGVRELQML